jgi:hypothetical protein
MDDEQGLTELLLQEKQLIDQINNKSVPMVFPLNKLNGYIIDTVPADILQGIENSIASLDLQEPDRLISNHYSLAGNIANQYAIPVDIELEDYVLWLCKCYTDAFPKFRESSNYSAAVDKSTQLQLEIFSLWVNFMKKYEFNPPHNHSGKFSFVIWYKIPYDLETEMRYSPSKRLDTGNLAGTFQFLYPYFSEEGLSLTNIRADKKYEGKICIFPSYLHHSVFPFYSSDKYRISIAGNLKVKNGD